MNKSKQKGTRFETDVVRYMQDNGWPDAERRALTGSLDRGDITGVKGFTLECKNRKELNLSGAVDEAWREFLNDPSSEHFAAILKRAGRNVADAYVVMPLEEFVLLLRELYGLK